MIANYPSTAPTAERRAGNLSELTRIAGYVVPSVGSVRKNVPSHLPPPLTLSQVQLKLDRWQDRNQRGQQRRPRADPGPDIYVRIEEEGGSEINPRTEDWTTANVPLWLLQRPEVLPAAKLLYGRLTFYAGKYSTARPSQGRLARELSLSDRQIRRLVRHLEDHQLLLAKKPKEGRDYYIFLRHPWQLEPIGSGEMPIRRRKKTAANLAAGEV